jgi:hypothetical protein
MLQKNTPSAMDGVFPMVTIDSNKFQKSAQTRLAGKAELLTSVVSIVLIQTGS